MKYPPPLPSLNFPIDHPMLAHLLLATCAQVIINAKQDEQDAVRDKRNTMNVLEYVHYY